ADTATRAGARPGAGESEVIGRPLLSRRAVSAVWAMSAALPDRTGWPAKCRVSRGGPGTPNTLQPPHLSRVYRPGPGRVLTDHSPRDMSTVRSWGMAEWHRHSWCRTATAARVSLAGTGAACSE